MRAQSDIDYERLLMDLEDSSSPLGLESYLMVTIYREVVHRHADCKGAVLSEQQRQLSMGVSEPLTIASISEEASSWSRRRARAISLLHARKS